MTLLRKLWHRLMWAIVLGPGACTPAKEAAADASYSADLATCLSADAAAYADCRRGVQTKWGRADAGNADHDAYIRDAYEVTETVHDAGGK